MYSKMPFLSLTDTKECIPKNALTLSKQNHISLPLCELIVKNAQSTDSIFYAIADLIYARRIINQTERYKKIMLSDDIASKKNLFEKIFKKETFDVLELKDNSDIIDILAKDFVC